MSKPKSSRSSVRRPNNYGSASSPTSNRSSKRETLRWNR